MSVLLRRSRGAGGQRVAKGEVHDHDLLLLVDDDLLGEPLQPLVLSVAELHERHVDRTLVVWDHHASEVAIRVAAEGDVHRRVHSGDGVAHHRPKTIRADHLAMDARSDGDRDHEGDGRKRTERAVPGNRSCLKRHRVSLLRWNGSSSERGDMLILGIESSLLCRRPAYSAALATMVSMTAMF